MPLYAVSEDDRNILRAVLLLSVRHASWHVEAIEVMSNSCLLYTSDAADERSSVDLGGRRIIKKKNNKKNTKER